MKKTLLATSALAGASVFAAGAATAGEAPVMSFSGNLSYEYIFVDNEIRKPPTATTATSSRPTNNSPNWSGTRAARPTTVLSTAPTSSGAGPVPTVASMKPGSTSAAAGAVCSSVPKTVSTVFWFRTRTAFRSAPGVRTATVRSVRRMSSATSPVESAVPHCTTTSRRWATPAMPTRSAMSARPSAVSAPVSASPRMPATASRRTSPTTRSPMRSSSLRASRPTSVALAFLSVARTTSLTAIRQARPPALPASKTSRRTTSVHR